MRLENRKGDENEKGIAWWEISVREFGIQTQVLFCKRHKRYRSEELQNAGYTIERAKVLYSGDK